MRFTPSQKRSRLLDVDITAMIDVVFLLIIFFMTTAQFARLTRADVDLPVEPGERRESDLSAAMVVNVARDGSIIVDQQTVTLERLTRMVAAEIRKVGGDGAAVELTVRADRSLSAGVLNEIARSLSGAGLRGVRLATEPPRGGGG